MDWGTGEYEHTAEQLVPAAVVVVGHLAPHSGERVVDLGCGTGNGTLVVGASGAEVTGVDPSERLLEVAAVRAAEAGIGADFAVGDAATLPVEDGSVDAVVSVFGLIFAPDPEAAAAEIARALRPGGRLVFSAWLPSGAIAEQMGVRYAAMAEIGEPLGPPPFAWHEAARLEELLTPHGFEVELHAHELPFTASSPSAYVSEQLATHPLWLATRHALGPRGTWDDLASRLVDLFTERNEDPAAFRVTSPYVVAVARRG